MKTVSYFLSLSALSALLLCIIGCVFPRYGSPLVLTPDTDAPAVRALSAEKAQRIIDNAIANPPAGHRPYNPGYLSLGRRATAVKLRVHNRTGLILVEIMSGNSQIMEFYVQDQEEGQLFANALWRAKREASIRAAE